MSYNPQNPNGQATSANSSPVVIASDQSDVPVSFSSLPAGTNTIGGVELIDSAGTNKAAISAGGALKVDGSAATQPVSDADLALTQGSSTSSQKGPLVQGAVTTGAPSYTTSQTSPLSLDTSGNLRTSVGNTVTVSGTVTTSPPSNASINLNQVAGGAVSNAGQTGALQVGGAVATNSNVSSATNPILIAGSDYGGTPKVQTMKVDSSGNAQVSVTNTPTVTANAGTNLNTSLLALESGGNLATLAGGVSSSKYQVNVSQINGSTTSTAASGTQKVGVVGNAGAAFDAATNAAPPANALQIGGVAATALPTAFTATDLAPIMLDKFGRQIVIANAQRDLVLPITQLTLTSTTTETTLIGQVASTFLDIVSLIVINTSATATQVDFRDSTAGTIRLSLYVPAGDTRGIALPTPMPQATVNNNWTAKCGTSVASVIITGSYISNK